MKTFALAVLSAVVLGGCAARHSGVLARAPDGVEYENGLICTNETPTGSRISRKVCRDPKQIEQERIDAEQFVRDEDMRRRLVTN
jgi:hypothetical protein